MWHRRSLGWAITLGVVMIVLLITLTVGWILLVVAANSSNSAVYWAILAVGAVFFLLVLVGVVLYLLLSIKEIRLNQRQSNFIDSVTHELKSPIASLKLYLQTLNRRNVTSQQQADFHRFMLEDVERLDTLINHLLDAARVDHRVVEGEVTDVDVSLVLHSCAQTACQRYGLPPEAIQLDVSPNVVRGAPMDVEMVFRNLIDNAIKYSGQPARVEVESRSDGSGLVITRISDNGRGIPTKMRGKIFGRFVRLGSELERAQAGTGLGLFIVRTLVRKMGGRVSFHARTPLPGTTFEVQLPGSSSESSKAIDPMRAPVVNPT